MDMEFTIRPAKLEDCPAMLDLIRELAVYERAPDEVTVSLEHFEQSGFGEKPVWWAFVACAPAKQEEVAETSAEQTQSAVSVQDPMLAHLLQETTEDVQMSETPGLHTITSEVPTEPMIIQLDEPVETSIPEQVADALPLTLQFVPCGQVIGFALYYIRYSTWKGLRMYLEDLLVTESWRCKGVGTALMDALIGAAKAEGLGGISWQVLEWNESAIKFYKRYNARLDGEWLNAAIDV